MIALEFLKAFTIGICASAPIGPVAILVLQKSITGGRKVGFATGLGATVVDTTYATLAIFAVALARDFINAHTCAILIAGGIIVSLVGVNMIRKKIEEGRRESVSASNTLQCMGCALANPGALAVMLGLVALFKMDSTPAPIWGIVPCVALGSITWWFSFSTVISRIGRSISIQKIKIVNIVAGIIVILLGVTLLVKGITMLAI